MRVNRELRSPTSLIVSVMSGEEASRGVPRTEADASPSVLVVINRGTAAKQHWQGLSPLKLADAGIYELWRLDRSRLEQRAADLRDEGVDLTWRQPRPERY